MSWCLSNEGCHCGGGVIHVVVGGGGGGGHSTHRGAILSNGHESKSATMQQQPNKIRPGNIGWLAQAPSTNQ